MFSDRAGNMAFSLMDETSNSGLGHFLSSKIPQAVSKTGVLSPTAPASLYSSLTRGGEEGSEGIGESIFHI